jgi:hypothetical protein
MINPESRTVEWIRQVAIENQISNITLIEKAIRAFSLLESLARSGCPFVFKGGSALMLHLNSVRRISIDIDIICAPETEITQYLSQYAEEYGFNEIKLIERKQANNVAKMYAKFYYQVTYTTKNNTEYILLDVLYENIYYDNIVQLPIENRFLKTKGETILINVPSLDDMLGDKLTAFAPNTTGIPYFKGNKSCSMDIIKQLFDIASLFDLLDDMNVVAKTFQKFASMELSYRNLNTENIEQVIDDIFNTALCICLQGKIDREHFRLLQDGIKRIQNFIHSEKYNLDSAILNASKTAYLATLLKYKLTEIEKYENQQQVINRTISMPLNTKLNKLKKSNPEAFFYWYKVFEVQQKQKDNIIISDLMKK